MGYKILQYLHSATVDSGTVNSATTTINSATANSKALKYCNISSEIRNIVTLFSATLNSATWRSSTSNSEH